MPTARQRRGRKTQDIARDYMIRRGFLTARTEIGAVTGRDIRDVPGVAPEVKATSGETLLMALRQAARNAGDDLPCVIWRPDGYGPERVEQWVFAVTFRDAMDLLIKAGYQNE